MMGISKLLSYSGRLLMVNSVVPALPTFYMCTLKIPASINEINRKGSCLVSWKTACRPNKN